MTKTNVVKEEEPETNKDLLGNACPLSENERNKLKSFNIVYDPSTDNIRFAWNNVNQLEKEMMLVKALGYVRGKKNANS